jgi:hypothetical protein
LAVGVREADETVVCREFTGGLGGNPRDGVEPRRKRSLCIKQT